MKINKSKQEINNKSISNNKKEAKKNNLKKRFSVFTFVSEWSDGDGGVETSSSDGNGVEDDGKV